mgnify:CR=1 FL=1
MAIEYLGLSSINGPLIVLEGVQDAFFDEIVEFVVNGNERKLGRIIEIYEDKAVIQVFEGTENMSLLNTHTKLTGHPMEIALSPDMLGRTFNGIGQPIDDLGPITSTLTRDINGLPLNPVKREYPRNYIRTGISAIDGLTTLIRGQKLPIFSGNGLPHDQLAAQIGLHASHGHAVHIDLVLAVILKLHRNLCILRSLHRKGELGVEHLEMVHRCARYGLIHEHTVALQLRYLIKCLDLVEVPLMFEILKLRLGLKLVVTKADGPVFLAADQFLNSWHISSSWYSHVYWFKSQ